ncbi:MAG: FAD-dependent oxidoreductase [Candidatus Omnitrophica bacterium]|nr:FAD-dependent oxidoreductase [Candidatus Omnitrophota bacterium]
MKRIVIIGNSLMSIAAIEEIRSVDQESEIVLFCPEGVLPYDRSCVSSILSEKLSSEDAYCKPASYFSEKRINIVLDKKIVKVHPKRKRIIFEDKNQESFDTLVIEDSGLLEVVDVEGAKKQGVFSLSTVSDAEKISKAAGLCDVVIIQPTSLSTLEAAVYLKNLNKEVIVVCPEESLLSSIVGKGAGDFLANYLKEIGIRIILNNALVEVLGEGEAKAIRLKTGKVLESQLVILEKTRKELFFFSVDENLAEQNSFYTKVGDIFIDSSFEILSKGQSAEDSDISNLSLDEKGKMIGAAIADHRQSYQQPFKKVIFSLGDLSGCVLGSLENESAVEYEQIDRVNRTYKKIFVADDRVAGAVLINFAQEVVQAEDIIKNKINISQLSGHALELKKNNEHCECNPFQSNSTPEVERVSVVSSQQNFADVADSHNIPEAQTEDGVYSADH